MTMTNLALNATAYNDSGSMTPIGYYLSQHGNKHPRIHIKQFLDFSKKIFENPKVLVYKLIDSISSHQFHIEYEYTSHEYGEHCNSSDFPALRIEEKQKILDNKNMSFYTVVLKDDNQNIITITAHEELDTYINMMAPISISSELFDSCKKIFDDLYLKFKPEKKINESYINFICRSSDGGYYTQEFEVSAGVDFDSIFDSYEDRFKEEFSDIVLSKLSDMTYTKGIVLLHGAPGTGKTTYLRYLLSKLKKKVMYLPPELGHSLSDPSFITFLMHNPNSILCIEDAENIIKTREAGGNQAVSNILNITDGILGSALKYQVICTFNAPFTEIDQALTRKGRMIGEYCFSALSKERTNYLIKKLYGDTVNPVHKGLTLAEIHTLNDEMPTAQSESRTIGF